MSRWKLAFLALTGAGLLVFGAFSFAASSAAWNPPASAKTNPGQANGHRDFVVSGHVEDLRPGGTQPMVLTVRNPNSVGIRVTSLTVRAAAASAACQPSSLTLPQWTGSLVVPKDGTATVTVNVTLEPSAPDACQGAQWPLAYGGTAVKA